MRPRPRRFVGSSTFVASLSLLACKPDASGSSSPLPPAPPVATPPAAAEPSREPAPPPAPIVYGYFRVPSPTALIAALRTGPLVPESQRSMIEESLLRSMIAMMIPAGSRISEHLDLAQPLGCVVTSPRLHDVPLACVVGYQGGLTRLVEDLGPEGYVDGGPDRAAYRLEGRSMFFTAMGQHVAFSFTPDLVAATREQLQNDLIAAPLDEPELVVTGFPRVIVEDSREQLLALVDQIARAQPPGPAQEAMQEAQRRQWLSWGELERAELWLDVSPERVRLGYRGTAHAGTDTERAYAAARDVPTEPAAESLMARLPDDPLMAMGMRFDMGSLIDDPMLGAYTQALTALGTDVALAEQYRRAFALWREISTGHAAGALLHERGTKGGLVITYDLRPGVDALPRLREYFELMQSAGSALVTTEVRPGALRLGKLRGDLVTLTLSPTLPAGAGTDALARALGRPPRIQMGVVQRGDTLTMAMAPAKVDRYLRRALAAADGKQPLGSVSAARELLEAQAAGTMLMTASVSSIVRWLASIDAIDPVTTTIPARLDDIVVAIRPAGERQREATLDLSASMLGALYQLTNKTPSP